MLNAMNFERPAGFVLDTFDSSARHEFNVVVSTVFSLDGRCLKM